MPVGLQILIEVSHVCHKCIEYWEERDIDFMTIYRYPSHARWTHDKILEKKSRRLINYVIN